MKQYQIDERRFVQLFSKFTGIHQEKLEQFMEEQPVNLLMEHTDLLDITARQREKLKDLRELKNLYGALKSSNKEYTVGNPSQAGAYFQAYFDDVKEKEYAVCSFLTTKNQIIATKVLSSGVVNESAVYPREIVKAALLHDAHSVILAHNHPSGNPDPSKQDIDLTYAVKYALDTVNISLVDHIVTGKDSFISLAEKGLYQQKSTSKWSNMRVAGNRDDKVREDVLDQPKEYILQYIFTHKDPTKEGRNATHKRESVRRVVSAENPMNAIEKGWERIASIRNTANIESVELAGMTWQSSPLDLQDYLNQQYSQSKMNETLELKMRGPNAYDANDQRLTEESERRRWFYMGCTSTLDTLSQDMKQVMKLEPPELMLELQWGRDAYKAVLAEEHLEEAAGLRDILEKARDGDTENGKILQHLFQTGAYAMQNGETLQLEYAVPRKIWDLNHEILFLRPDGSSYAPAKEMVQEAFNQAIEANQTEVIETMIREIPDVRLISGSTGFLVSKEQLELAEKLIDKADSMDSHGAGYLIFRFAEDRNDRVVDKLVQKIGESKDFCMTEALSLCADNNGFTTAGYLLRHGADFAAMKSTWDYWKKVGLMGPKQEDFFKRLEKYNNDVVVKGKERESLTLGKGMSL